MNKTFQPKHWPLSKKQENIGAFSRLLNLAQEQRYQGERLDDRTVEGLVFCVSTWLSLKGYSNFVKGNTVVIFFDDGDYLIHVAGNHLTHPGYPRAEYTGHFELTIYNLMGFVKWFDENF